MQYFMSPMMKHFILWTIVWHIPININQPTKRPMGTALLLLVSALLCFAVFYKAIDWFERI